MLLGRAFNEWRTRVRRRVFRRLVRRLRIDLTHASVLDVGCGTGVYLAEWQAFGVACLSGLDFSDWALTQLARAYPSATFYDAVFERALCNLHSTLKPGGYLIYSDTFSHGPEMQDGEYWKGRSIAAVEAAMRASDFKMVCRVPSSVLMSPPTDTRHRERNAHLWDIAMAPVRRRERIGHLYGAVLYPIEMLLVSTLRESPATELMVCRGRT